MGTEINLLLAASKTIPEHIIRRHLERAQNINCDAIYFIDNSTSIKKVASDIWPKAREITISQSLTSYKKGLNNITHLIFVWDGDDLSRLLFEAKIKGIKTNLIPINITKVVNKKETTEYDVYIGRGTPWGNPFAISYDDGPDRADVISKYKEFFDQKIESDETFRKGILAMRGLRLACFCKPSPCHGDVIANYLNSYSDDEPGADNK